MWEAKDALKDVELNTNPTDLLLSDPKFLPRCSKCNSLAFPNVNAGEIFVNEPYRKDRQKFIQFLNEYSNKNLVIIELGCGTRMPYIRHPLDNVLEHNESVKMIRINPIEPEVHNKERSIGLPYGAKDGISLLVNALQ